MQIDKALHKIKLPDETDSNSSDRTLVQHGQLRPNLAKIRMKTKHLQIMRTKHRF